MKKRSIENQLQKYEKELIESSIQTILRAQARHMRDLPLDSNPKAFFFQGSVMHGQSGGPILNRFGQVIGVTTNGFLRNDGISVGGAGVLVNY